MFGDHGLCGLPEEGAHGKSPKCLDGNLGDFGEFCKGLNLRTTILCPGAVESELKHGSSSEMASGAMENFYAHNEIPASSFARTVLFAISQPEEVDINEIIFRPTRQEV